MIRCFLRIIGINFWEDSPSQFLPFGFWCWNQSIADTIFLLRRNQQWTLSPESNVPRLFWSPNSIINRRIVYYATTAYSITLRTSARRSPECIKKYARVAYVILCNSVWKVRYNECSYGDEKPPSPIRDGRVYRGKERTYRGKERVQGRSPWWGSRGRSPRRGVGGRCPPLAEQYFFILEKKRKY